MVALAAYIALAFAADTSGGTSRFRPGPGSLTILMIGQQRARSPQCDGSLGAT